MLDPNASPKEGIFNPDYKEGATTGSMNNKELTRSPEFRQVVEGERVMNFFSHFLGGEPLSFDFKWLRTVGTGASSPIHCDIVFMGRGTQNLYSCWTPIGDVALDLSARRMPRPAQPIGAGYGQLVQVYIVGLHAVGIGRL